LDKQTRSALAKLEYGGSLEDALKEIKSKRGFFGL
jgi:hypothetical protein